MAITKQMLNQAYSLNRAVNRLYSEKDGLKVGKLSHYLIKQEIHRLENELEKFPNRLVSKVRDMLDARDFNRDRYLDARWARLWCNYEKIITTPFTDTQIKAYAGKAYNRQHWHFSVTMALSLDNLVIS